MQHVFKHSETLCLFCDKGTGDIIGEIQIPVGNLQLQDGFVGQRSGIVHVLKNGSIDVLPQRQSGFCAEYQIKVSIGFKVDCDDVVNVQNTFFLRNDVQRANTVFTDIVAKNNNAGIAPCDDIQVGVIPPVFTRWILDYLSVTVSIFQQRRVFYVTDCLVIVSIDVCQQKRGHNGLRFRGCDQKAPITLDV